MPYYIFLAASVLLIAYLGNSYKCFKTNLTAAKQSGIPYILSPIFVFHPFWLVTHRLWLLFIRRLPHSWTHPWIDYLTPDFPWEKLYDSFEEVGSDTFLVVSPGKLLLLVADPEAITQITTRRNDFPKPIEVYRSLDLFGKNVVTLEGHSWRRHRRITSPPFTERNNVLVWQESLLQAQSMMSGWMGSEQNSSGPLKDIASEAMRLSLHVISRAGFGVGLKWPHEESTEEVPTGHTLSYKRALETLLANILVVMLTPKSILRSSPLKMHKVANEAYREWGLYMKEMYHEKLNEVKCGTTSTGLDLMGALVKGAGITAESLSEDSGTDGEKTANAESKQRLSYDEILGNAFVFILAGHETAANTIHFSILYLAMHMSSQRRLQEDLDAILGDKPISEWNYDEDVPKLFGGMCGAVMNEELRLIPPVIGIPKSTLRDRPQGMRIDGRHVTVPGGTFIELVTPALHRNPKYWPGGDLTEFKPERWLLDSSKSNTNSDEEASEKEDLDIDGPDNRPDTSASLYRPKKGQYVPFSEGYRSCLGRRFAQVEILAVLAFIFKTWSVELDVSAYISDEDFASASEAKKREAWNKADANARDLLRNGMLTIITLQMRKDKVPLRFVKRGHERFNFG